MQFIKKYWKITLGVVLVLAIGGGYWGITAYQNGTAQAEVDTPVQTATIRQGDIIVSASGGGTVIPASEIDLSFSSSGILAELPVRVGQEVKAGEVLAQLGNLASLNAGVASAELNVLKAQQALDDLQVNASMTTANAGLALANAEIALNTAVSTNLGQQPEFRSDYGANIASLEADLIIANDAVDKAEATFEEVAHLAADNIRRARALSDLEGAKESRDTILRELNWYYGGPSEIDQTLLDAEVALAQAAYEEALRAYEAVADGPDADAIALAEAELTNAQASLGVAQENLAGATLIAPFEATVITIYADEGESVGTNAVITIADVNNPLIEIYLDETDFNLIDLDYEVEVVFDAFPDDIFTGYIIQVDPQLITLEGVPAVRGIVQLDDSFAETGIVLLIGSNASIEVIAGRAERAILVPVEALREVTAEQYAVFVMVDGEPELRMVEVGLIDITYVEILSGLEPGDVVTTGVVETK